MNEGDIEAQLQQRIKEQAAQIAVVGAPSLGATKLAVGARIRVQTASFSSSDFMSAGPSCPSDQARP